MGWIPNIELIKMPLPDTNNWSSRIYELLKETDLENLSYAQFQGVAEKLFIEPENEDELRRLVLVQLARMAVRGDWDGFLTGGGGSGAPTDAEYVVMALNGTLTNERKLTAGSRISITDGGAGGNVTIAADASPVTSIVAGTNITISPVSGLGDVTINGASGAPTDASYVTLGLNGDLSAERVLTAGSGITLTDGGAGSTLTIAASGGGGNDFNAELVGVTLDAAGTGYGAFDILSLPPYGCSRYTTGSIDVKQYFYPFIAPKSGDLDELIVNFTSGASGATNVYYAIYRDNSGVPSTVLGYATANGQTTGSQSITSFSGTITLARGTQYWLAQNKSTTDSITQRAIDNTYRMRIAPYQAFPSTTNGYGTSLVSNSSVSSTPADTTAEDLEPGIYFSTLGSCPHISIKIL